jgi:hypothetical protein
MHKQDTDESEAEMAVVMIVTNVVFAALVIASMVALHGRAIAADLARQPRQEPLRRAPQAHSPRWEPRALPAR